MSTLAVANSGAGAEAGAGAGADSEEGIVMIKDYDELSELEIQLQSEKVIIDCITMFTNPNSPNFIGLIKPGYYKEEEDDAAASVSCVSRPAQTIFYIPSLEEFEAARMFIQCRIRELEAGRNPRDLYPLDSEDNLLARQTMRVLTFIIKDSAYYGSAHAEPYYVAVMMVSKFEGINISPDYDTPAIKRRPPQPPNRRFDANFSYIYEPVIRGVVDSPAQVPVDTGVFDSNSIVSVTRRALPDGGVLVVSTDKHGNTEYFVEE